VNQVDALLLVLLAPFALRGYWRGFCREGFGLAGILGGLFAAAATGTRLAEVLVARHLVPPAAALLVARVGVFLVVCLGAGVLGRMGERMVRALALGGLSRIAGVVVASVKGAAILGFALLLAQRLVPSLTEVIAASRLGRPLTELAREVLEAGQGLRPAPAGRQA